MPNLSQIAEEIASRPIHKLMWEERERLGTVLAYWGVHCCLATSRQGGWAALEKGLGSPMVQVVVLGSPK